MKLKYITVSALIASIIQSEALANNTSMTCNITTGNDTTHPILHSPLLTLDDVFNETAAIIAEIMEIDRSSISRESMLYGDLNIESLDMYEITVLCQEQFNIEYRVEDVLSCYEFMDVITFADINYHFIFSDEDYQS